MKVVICYAFLFFTLSACSVFRSKKHTEITKESHEQGQNSNTEETTITIYEEFSEEELPPFHLPENLIDILMKPIRMKTPDPLGQDHPIEPYNNLETVEVTAKKKKPRTKKTVKTVSKKQDAETKEEKPKTKWRKTVITVNKKTHQETKQQTHSNEAQKEQVKTKKNNYTLYLLIVIFVALLLVLKKLIS